MNNIVNTLEESLFPVIEMAAPHPMHEYDGWTNQPSGYKYIVREDTSEVISCKTDDYMLVPNKRIIDAVTPVIEKLDGQLVDVSMFGNARTSYKYRFPQEVGYEDDILNPEIIIRNSYDGTVGVHILAGVFRLICSNGMIIGTIVKEINSKHLIHNKNLEVLEDNIHDTIGRLTALMNSAINSLMSVNPIAPSHLVKVISFFPTRVKPYVIEKITKERPTNYWELINIATYITTHVMNRKAESTHKFEQNLFTKIRKLANVTGRT